MAGLVPEKLLKDDIISDLTSEEKSISGLQKSLESKGRTMHRLVLTGYLRALVDVGILREKEIKPSRIYSLNLGVGKDIYDYVGLVSRRIGSESVGDDALMLLNFLFNRPIFAREIERCNVDPARDYTKVIPQNKPEIIEKLSELGMHIPQSNTMMEPAGRDKAKLIRLLHEIVNSGMDLVRYLPNDRGRIQTTLD